jgi:hypothetical protein
MLEARGFVIEKVSPSCPGKSANGSARSAAR